MVDNWEVGEESGTECWQECAGFILSFTLNTLLVSPLGPVSRVLASRHIVASHHINRGRWSVLKLIMLSLSGLNDGNE